MPHTDWHVPSFVCLCTFYTDIFKHCPFIEIGESFDQVNLKISAKTVPYEIFSMFLLYKENIIGLRDSVNSISKFTFQVHF